MIRYEKYDAVQKTKQAKSDDPFREEYDELDVEVEKLLDVSVQGFGLSQFFQKVRLDFYRPICNILNNFDHTCSFDVALQGFGVVFIAHMTKKVSLTLSKSEQCSTRHAVDILFWFNAHNV